MVDRNKNHVFEVTGGFANSKYYIIAKTFTGALVKLKKQKINGIKNIVWLGSVSE